MTPAIQGQYAGAVTRGVAFVIDMFLIGVTLTLTSWLVNATLGLVGIDVRNCPPFEFPGPLGGLVCNLTRVGLALFALVFPSAYALFFWTFGGQTIGMGIMGIRVVRTDGKPMSILRSLRRLVGFAICLLTLGIGFLWVLVDNDRRGWHDRLAGTCVIYAWRGEQNVETIERVRAWVDRRRRRARAGADSSE